MPINRLVAFVIKPIVTIVVATVSAWLVQHVPGIDLGDATANIEAITSAIAFVVGGFITSTGFDKWLEGWIKHEENSTLIELNSPPVDPAVEAQAAKTLKAGA